MKPANRLKNLPPYLFAELDRAKKKLRGEGADIIDLSIGDPDMEPPAQLKQYLADALNIPEIHRYPSYAGSPEFRKAVAAWMAKRHDASVNPDGEVVALIGAKEGIVHFVMATIDEGDTIVTPSPCYPPYIHATILAGGKAHEFPLTPETDFQPDFDAVPAKVWEKAKVLFLNYPNNPTSATATRATFEKAIELGRKYDFIVVNDAAYIDVASPDNLPLSILAIPGAKDVAIEFHSLSKTFNICGWRIGWCAGNKEIVGLIGRFKESVDSGAFTAIQHACAQGMATLEDHIVGMQGIYMTRREALTKQLSLMGLKVLRSNAGFYVWAKLKSGKSTEFCTNLLEKAHVAATPGLGFGKHGEGYVRFSLTASTERINEAIERMAKI
jgi:LL-diaminopimelate aminotransferase